MIDETTRARARAKQLAALARIDGHPWGDADKQLKEAQEAEAVAAREAEIQQDAADAAEFRAAHADVKELLAKRAAVTERILAKGRELEGLGNAGQVYGIITAWQRSPAGLDWKLCHQFDISRVARPGQPLESRGTAPMGLSWPDVDRAILYEKLNNELGAIRSELVIVEQCLAIHFTRFPALRDLQGVPT